MKNVTRQYKDVNSYDKIYLADTGRTIKVRVEDISTSPSILSFRVTGSWADDKTGKALAFDTGEPFIVEPHELVIRLDSEVDLVKAIEAARLDMARRVEIAIENHIARQALKGIKRKSHV